MDHPEKIMNDAVQMYSCRIAVAVEERTHKYRDVGMFVLMEGHTRIVPDMKVRCFDKEELLLRVDVKHPTVSGAMAMMQTDDRDEVPFGVIFADGGAMLTRLKVFDADRDRRNE